MPGCTSALGAALDEGERLDDHPLAAGGGQLLPPRDGLVLAALVGDVDEAPLRALHPGGVRVDERVAAVEVPAVVAVDEDAALGGQDVERRQPEVVEPVDRPDVTPVGVAVPGDVA